MERRFDQEFQAFVVCILAHFLVLMGTMVCGHLVRSSGGVLDIGAREMTTMLDVAELAELEETQSKSAVSGEAVSGEVNADSAATSRSGTQAEMSNPIEKQLKPLHEMYHDEKLKVAERYSTHLNEKNIQLDLRVNPELFYRVGHEYLFTLSNGHIRVFSSSGESLNPRAGYAIGVNRADLSSELASKVKEYLDREEFDSARVSLMLSLDMEIEMHRSLFASLDSNNLKELQPNHLYVGNVKLNGFAFEIKWRSRKIN